MHQSMPVCGTRALSLAAVLVVGVAACSNGCEEPQRTKYASPMADRAAVLIRQVCASGFGNGSEEYSIVIVKKGHEFPVFKVSAPRPPTVEWKSASELDVAPSVAVKPELSAAFAGDIAIRYRIPADLRPDVLAANVNGYRQRVEVEIRAGRATFVGGSVEQNLGSLQAAVDRAREDNDTFSRWARAVGAIDASGR